MSADAPGHDRRFKELLREFFAEFLTLFFPERVARLDLTAPEWLDKELAADATAGGVRLLDLLARVPYRDGTAAGEAVLIHIEAESRDAVTNYPRRMYDYFAALRARHPDLPILPVAVYLRVGREGVGVEEYAEVTEGRRSCGSGTCTSACRPSTRRRTPPAATGWGWRWRR